MLIVQKSRVHAAAEQARIRADTEKLNADDNTNAIVRMRAGLTNYPKYQRAAQNEDDAYRDNQRAYALQLEHAAKANHANTEPYPGPYDQAWNATWNLTEETYYYDNRTTAQERAY